MKNNSSFGAIALILTIVISIGSGVLAWNWIEPDSFMGTIGFIIVWGVLSKIGHLIAIGIGAALSK